MGLFDNERQANAMQKSCDSYNKQAERNACRDAFGKIGAIQQKLSKRFGETLSIDVGEWYDGTWLNTKPAFPFYKEFGYYTFKATAEYTTKHVSTKSETYNNGSYTATENSSGGFTISADTSSRDVNEIKEGKATFTATRLVKVVTKGKAGEVRANEKAFENNVYDTKLFLEIKNNTKTSKPNWLSFFLFNLVTILFALGAVAYYATSSFVDTNSINSPLYYCYWEKHLFALIPQFGEWILSNGYLLYATAGGTLLLFALLTLVFKTGADKCLQTKYSKMFTTKSISKILVIVLAVQMVFSLLNFVPALVSVDGTILSMLTNLLLLILGVSRAVGIMASVTLIVMSVVDIFGGNLYSRAKLRINQRNKFVENGQYDFYLKKYNTIMTNTLFIRPFSLKRTITEQDFEDSIPKLYAQPMVDVEDVKI